MIRKFLFVLICAFFLFVAARTVRAQQAPAERLYRGTVIKADKEISKNVGGVVYRMQPLQVLLEDNGKKIRVEYTPTGKNKALTKDDQVVIREINTPQGKLYFVSDRYRFPSVLIMLGFFVILAFIFGRTKALASIGGLLFSVYILIYYVVPSILSGGNPFIISFFGALLIAVVSLYLAHGFSMKTTISLISTVITIAIATVLAYLFVEMTSLSGTGSEEAVFLQLETGVINLKGLLLGGMVIGALGVLDDVTTAQVAAVYELKLANHKLSVMELYRRGFNVGKEHIASLINTLVLAYVGASFPLLLLFTSNKTLPLWASMNSEFIVEEIVRTIVGSSALILAVPISTYLAAEYFGRHNPTLKHTNKNTSL